MSQLKAIVLVAISYFCLSGFAHSAIIFDYMTICDNCRNPAATAKDLVPSYQGIGMPGGPDEYLVLVTDAESNKYYAYEVLIDAPGKQTVNDASLTRSLKEVADKALLYYYTKGKLLKKLNRSQIATDQVCSNPGIVYNDLTCQNFYIEDMNQHVLESELTEQSFTFNSLPSAFQPSIRKLLLTPAYDRPVNTVVYNLTNGVIIAFTLNDLRTGIIGMDLLNSSYANGVSIQYYAGRTSMQNASGYSAQKFIDVQNCHVTSGSIEPTYRYTIKRESGGGVYVGVHTDSEQQGPTIECN